MINLKRMTAVDYLQQTSREMDGGYTADCVAHACALAELLAAEGRSPWIARLRHVTMHPRGVLHHPLMPRRFTGDQARTWNTHYVCCCDGVAYDPIVGEPIAIQSYSRAVFAADIDAIEFLSPAETAERIRSGTLKAAFAQPPRP